jgi:hypothetical protein
MLKLGLVEPQLLGKYEEQGGLNQMRNESESCQRQLQKRLR